MASIVVQTSCGGMSITEVRRSTLVYFSIHGNTKKMPRAKMQSVHFRECLLRVMELHHY